MAWKYQRCECKDCCATERYGAEGETDSKKKGIKFTAAGTKKCEEVVLKDKEKYSCQCAFVLIYTHRVEVSGVWETIHDEEKIPHLNKDGTIDPENGKSSDFDQEEMRKNLARLHAVRREAVCLMLDDNKNPVEISAPK